MGNCIHGQETPIPCEKVCPHRNVNHYENSFEHKPVENIHIVKKVKYSYGKNVNDKHANDDFLSNWLAKEEESLNEMASRFNEETVYPQRKFKKHDFYMGDVEEVTEEDENDNNEYEDSLKEFEDSPEERKETEESVKEENLGSNEDSKELENIEQEGNKLILPETLGFTESDSGSFVYKVYAIPPSSVDWRKLKARTERMIIGIGKRHNAKITLTDESVMYRGNYVYPVIIEGENKNAVFKVRSGLPESLQKILIMPVSEGYELDKYHSEMNPEKKKPQPVRKLYLT